MGDSQQPVAARPATRRPKWPIPLALLGLLGLALAAILGSTNRARAELPNDFNAVRQYSGTANGLLNLPALQAGDFNNAIMSNTPVTGQTTVRVLDNSGDNARVLDERTLNVGGTQIGGGSNTYAVNRRTMEPASGAPQDWNVQPHQGLAVGFPADAQRHDYQGWVSDTQTTTTLRFVREENRGGVNTFVYQTDMAQTPIRDQSVLASLPSSLSRAQLQGIVPSLPVSADQRTALSQALPGLPDQVPMNYTSQGSATFWVEPTTGQIVDTQRSVIRNGTIGGPGGATLATLPVYNVDTAFTADSVAAAGREAADRRDTLNTSGRVWPWILGTLGALALIAGLLGLLMRRRPEPAPRPPAAGQRPTEPARRPRPTEAQRPEEREAGRRRRESQPGGPQPPYGGATRHTGPYREARPGEPEHAEHAPSEEEQPPRRRPGQQP